MYLARVQTAQPFGGKKIICVSLLTDINDKAEAYQWAREYLGLVCLTNLPGSDLESRPPSRNNRPNCHKVVNG